MGFCIGIFLIPVLYLAIVGMLSGLLAGRGVMGVIQKRFEEFPLADLFGIDFGWGLAVAVGATAGSSFLCVALVYIDKLSFRVHDLAWTFALFIAGLVFGMVAALVGWRTMNYQIKNIEEEENST